MTRSKAHPRPTVPAGRWPHDRQASADKADPRPVDRPMTAGTIVGLQRSSGNSAVAGLLGAPSLQRKKQQAGLVFHPKSTLSAARIVTMLKRNKNVPDFISKSLSVRQGAIVVTGTPVAKDRIAQFLETYLAAMTSPGWQFTTATSTIEVTGPPGSPAYRQIVRPDLAKGQRLGKDVKSGPDETTFFATTLFSTTSEVVYGWTIDSGDTSTLGTGRGLIVVVTKIAVTRQDGTKKVFTPTEDMILEALLHEISAHAGRITAGQPDTHGTRAVDEIADELGGYFRESTAARGLTPSATSTEIFAFIDGTAKPATAR